MAGSKAALFGALDGHVLEIGPGSGASLRHFSPSIRWTGVEPNRWTHDYLRHAAAKAGIEADIREGVGESLPVPDNSVDAVVSSLVLCTVSDPAAALREIRRVLKPGGQFVFIEHVAAPRGTWLRRVQRLMRKPQAVLADGCRPDQETWKLIEQAGFSSVLLCHDRVTIPIAPHVMGKATK